MSTTESDPLPIDLGALQRRLGADGVPTQGELWARPIGEGQSNLTYLVGDAAGSRLIVRRPPRGNLLPSAHDVLREARILAALADTAVPVPHIVGTYTDAEISDAPVVVMEFVDGAVIDTMAAAAALEPEARRATGYALARTLADVHRIAPADVGLSDLSSHKPYAERQLRRWSQQWAASKTRDLPHVDALTALLARKAPPPDELVLVHGDFHLRNAIVDPSGSSVRAVLDWELSTLGDPIADLGSLLAYWPESSDGDTLVFAASALPDFVDRDEIARAYLEASGRPGDFVTYWHVFGLWKVLIIAEGVLRRAVDTGTLPPEEARAAAGSISTEAERVWAMAESSGLVD